MKVSVVIPTYNRAHFIGEALASVMAQTRPVHEIIVVDDGSTDGTRAVVENFPGPVRYVPQPNSGPSVARNRGVKEAKGDLVAFLDSDDLWVPEKIAIQVGFMEANPELEFVFGLMVNFDGKNPDSAPEIKSQAIHKHLIENSACLDELADCLVLENVIPTSSVLFRRSSSLKIGEFDRELGQAEDLDYWFRAATRCRCGFVNTVVEKRRRHEGNLINDWIRRTESTAKVLARFGESKPRLPDKTLRLVKRRVRGLHYDLGSRFLKMGDHAQAVESFAKMGFARFWHPKALAKYLACALLVSTRQTGAGSQTNPASPGTPR